jgi:cyclophilin family peptidyl-prolyl cis-trans isomerase
MGLKTIILLLCYALAGPLGACVSGGGSTGGPAVDASRGGGDSAGSDDTTPALDAGSAVPETHVGGDTDVLLDASTALDVPAGSDTQPVDAPGPQGNPQVTIVTTMGEFTIELKEAEAPISTANFLKYVKDGFYDGDDGLGATTFHRVIKDFMVQGGGVLADKSSKEPYPPIVNESTNGLSNVRGSVAMARKGDPDTATSQFFVNHIDNDFLNYADAQNPGYAVFGLVVSGMDVVDAIADTPTDLADMPLQPIEIVDVLH